MSDLFKINIVGYHMVRLKCNMKVHVDKVKAYNIFAAFTIEC